MSPANEKLLAKVVVNLVFVGACGYCVGLFDTLVLLIVVALIFGTAFFLYDG